MVHVRATLKWLLFVIVIGCSVLSSTASAFGLHSFITKPTTISSQELTSNSDTWALISWGASTGAVSYTVRWATDDYPADNVTGTLGYSGVSTSANVTSLTATTTYFSIFAIGHSGSLWSCSTATHLLRDYGNDFGSEIYYNPSEEDELNPYLEVAADDLETYLESMSGDSYTVVTDAPPEAPAIYIDVDATEMAAYNDEAFKIVVSTNGVEITGKTAIACRHGAYYLLDEMLGVRWLQSNPLWTIVPDSLATIPNGTTIIQPQFLWRLTHIQNIPSAVGAQDLYDWQQHNRMYGAYEYNIVHSYGSILDHAVGWYSMTNQQKIDYGNAHPTYFLPNDGYPYTSPPDAVPWQLDFSVEAVMDMAKDYIRDNLILTSPRGNDTLPVRAVPFSGNDGGNFDPPYVMTQTENLTDTVFGWVKEAADDIAEDFPDGIVGVLSYEYFSDVPTIDLPSNMLVVVDFYLSWAAGKGQYDRFVGIQAQGSPSNGNLRLCRLYSKLPQN